MEAKGFCPLGSQCEEIKDGAVHRCNWFVRIAGKHPQTGETVDEERCALAWSAILLVENARTNRGQTAAIESFRNESVKGQSVFNSLLKYAIDQRPSERLIDG